MEREAILKKVKKIVATQLEVNRNQVITEANFINDLGADSLDMIEIMMSIEDQFNINIPDNDIENLLTVSDVVVYIHLYPNLKGKGGKKKTIDRLQANDSMA